jgi:hypothetical protein
MKTLSVILWLVLACAVSLAADVTLQWDDTTNPAGTSYRLYHRVSPATTYTRDCLTADTANCRNAGTSKTFTWTGLTPGTHFWVVTAYNSAGESGYSNEVTKIIESIPVPPTTLKITAMSASLRWFGVVCLAQTSEKSSAIFKYQPAISGAGWSTIVATPQPSKTQHRAVLYLSQAGYYNYVWEVTDNAGNTVTDKGSFQFINR